MKKKIIIIIISIIVIVGIIIGVIFFLNNKKDDITVEVIESYANEEHNNYVDKYECIKSEVQEILKSDLNQNELEDNTKEIVETDEDEEPKFIKKRKIDNSSANIGNVAISKKVIITFYDSYFKTSQEITYKFDSKEGYDNYHIPVNDNGNIGEKEESLEKVVQEVFDSTKKDEDFTSSDIEKEINSYKELKYTCTKVTNE